LFYNGHSSNEIIKIFVVALLSKNCKVNRMDIYKNTAVYRNTQSKLPNFIKQRINCIFNKNMITKLELLTSKHSLPILVHRKVAVNVLAEFSCNTTINCKELDNTFSHGSQLTQLMYTFLTKLLASPEQKRSTALHCSSLYSLSH
jgi:hypothetical protein